MMATCYNPSLSEESRNQPVKVIPALAQESILNWLERTGRLWVGDEVDERQDHKMMEDLDDILEPEIYDLDSEEE